MANSIDILLSNIISNMANNYCVMDNCPELKEQVKIIIKEDNRKKFSIYRLLVSNFGRIIKNKKTSFVGELALEQNYTLLNELNRHLFMKVQQRKKYAGNDDVFVVFFVM